MMLDQKFVLNPEARISFNPVGSSHATSSLLALAYFAATSSTYVGKSEFEPSRGKRQCKMSAVPEPFARSA